jgi:hypothetical protein
MQETAPCHIYYLISLSIGDRISSLLFGSRKSMLEYQAEQFAANVKLL